MHVSYLLDVCSIVARSCKRDISFRFEATFKCDKNKTNVKLQAINKKTTRAARIWAKQVKCSYQ